MNERLRPEQVSFYHENGFLGPIDLLSQDEVAEIRRHVEEIEAKLGVKMMSRFRIKAHLPFPFLCDLVSHPRLLDAVEDLIGPNVLCWGSSFKGAGGVGEGWSAKKDLRAMQVVNHRARYRVS